MADYKTFDQKNWIKTNLAYRKDTGSWAWILHRISGIALIGYLFLHIYSVSSLAQGKVAFNSFMEHYTGTFFKQHHFKLHGHITF